MMTINHQTFTYFKTQAEAAELAAKLQAEAIADGTPEEYRAVEAVRGWFVAIFEDDEQVFTL